MAATPLPPTAAGENPEGNPVGGPPPGTDLTGISFRDQLWLNTYPLDRNLVFDYFALSPFYDPFYNNDLLRLRRFHLPGASACQRLGRVDNVIAMVAVPSGMPVIMDDKNASVASRAQSWVLLALEPNHGCFKATFYETVGYMLMSLVHHTTNPLDAFGEHAVHCRELPGFKYRHDFVRDVLYDVLRHAGVASKKEAPVNFLTDPQEGRSTLRPADVLIFGWAGGKHACVDLTGVSPLVSPIRSDFIAGHAAQKAASAKVAKHEKACIDNQHVFIPFGFDTFGFLATEAVQLLKRVQRIMHSNVMVPRSIDVVFRRIGFAIQKGLAAQLVARLPSLSL